MENYTYSILKNNENELPLYVIYNNKYNYKFFICITNLFFVFVICAFIWFLL